jgi:hypothetical protein
LDYRYHHVLEEQRGQQHILVYHWDNPIAS